MQERAQVVVVGLGAMGSAALAHLARQGVDAIGLDAFTVGHTRGSSHGWSRVVRQAYFEHRDYVPLLVRAFDLWEELEAMTGADILHRVGVLITGSDSSDAIRRSRDSAIAHGIEVEEIAPDALRQRFGQFSLPDDVGGLLEPGGGFVIPEHGIAAHLEVARRHGATAEHGVRIDSIAGDGDGVRIETTAGTLLADRCIVAAGAWTLGLLPQLARAGLSPQRKLLVWFEPRDAAACDATRMPVWLIDDGGACGNGVYYGIPTWRGQVGPAGVKVGFHGPGEPIEPGQPGSPDSARVRRFAEDMRRHLPVLGPPRHSVNCTYTMSLDEHFVIDTVPEAPGIVVACGFSGHGFKFAPAIGEVLAALATDREPRCAIDFLRLSRLALRHSDFD